MRVTVTIDTADLNKQEAWAFIEAIELAAPQGTYIEAHDSDSGAWVHGPALDGRGVESRANRTKPNDPGFQDKFTEP